jgi:hypothetical protein
VDPTSCFSSASMRSCRSFTRLALSLFDFRLQTRPHKFMFGHVLSRRETLLTGLCTQSQTSLLYVRVCHFDWCDQIISCSDSAAGRAMSAGCCIARGPASADGTMGPSQEHFPSRLTVYDGPHHTEDQISGKIPITLSFLTPLSRPWHN